MRTGTRVLINAISKWLSVGARGLSALVLIPFLLSELGKDGYGLTALLLALIGLGRILDLGLRNATSKLLADQVALGDKAKFNELASTSLAAFVCLGGLGGLLCAVLAGPIVGWMRVPDHLTAEAVFLVRWFGGTLVFLQVVQPMFAAVLESRNRFDLFTGVVAVAALFEMGAVLLVVGVARAGIYGWASVMAASMAGSVVALAVLARRTCPGLRLSRHLVRLPALFNTLKLSGQVFLLQLNQLVSIHSDPFVLSRFLGPAALAVYTPATNLKIFGMAIAGVLSNQLHPLAAGASATGNLADLRAVLYRGTRYTFLMGIPAAVFLGVFSGPITRIWLGDSLGEGYRTAANVLLCWSIISLFSYAMGSQWPVLLGTQRLRFVVVFRTVTGMLNLLLSIVLVGYTSLGVIGALIPTIIIEAVRLPVFSAYTAWVCESSLSAYVRRSHAKPMLVLVAFLALAGAVRALFPIRTLWMLLISAALLGLWWAVLTWMIGFTAEDRAQFRRLFDKGRGLLQNTRYAEPKDGEHQ